MVSVAIMGHGVVGSGVAEILLTHKQKLFASLGEEIHIKKVLDLREFPDSPMHILQDNRASMADMSVYMSRKVNGVAEIHTDILKNDLFREWQQRCPGKILNITNGVTPRRWLGLCDAELTSLIRSVIGEGFLRDLDRIGYLKGHIDDALAARFNEVKLAKKRQLSEHIRRAEGVEIPPERLPAVQKKLITKCRLLVKRVITATEML